MGYCKCGVAHCYDPLRLSLRSLDLSPGGRSHPLVILHLGGHCSKVGMHTHTSLSGVLLPPLSGEVKTLQHLHARVCARSGTCQMWDRDSATTDNVCRQCKTMRAEERGCHCWFALLPPLSGEKSRHYTLACTCLCAQWNLSNVGP